MGRTNLKTLSVYVTEEQYDLLSKAAAKDRRSLSNFLLSEGLERAEELGVATSGQVHRAQPEGRKVASV